MNKSILKALTFLFFIILTSATQAAVLEVRISDDNDDAEQRSNGSISRGSSDLEMMYDGSIQDAVGLRFRNITIPQGATINSAYIEFTADESDDRNTRLLIYGQNSDDANAFSTTNNDITDRPTTSNSILWDPEPWTTGNTYQTSDIASVIQEVVNRVGWASGNNLAILVYPNNNCVNSQCARVAESYDGSSANAAKLVIDYDDGGTTPPPGNCAGTLDLYNGSANDDAIETISNGNTSLTGRLDIYSSNLTGIRFDNITVPQGATITSAYIEFTAQTTTNGTGLINIRAQDIDDAPVFAGGNTNISSRSLTGTNVSWATGRWQNNNKYQTVDISNLVKEVIDRPGWSSGNALAFVLTNSSSNKVAYSFDSSGGGTRAPRLVIEYDGCGVVPGVCSDNVLDNFDIQSFSNDDGSHPWSGPWTEYDNAGSGPASGKVRIENGILRLDNYTGGEWNGNPGVEREVDLSEFKSARLKFDYELLGGVDNQDWFRVRISSDGGATWERTWDILNQNDGSYSFDEDITPYISANTVVGIRIYDEDGAGTTACCYGGNNERIEIDFVEIVGEDICDAVVEYRFEELSWNGTNGEVYNEIGTGMNGTAFGGANTSNAIPPDAAIIGDPGTCRFGQYDGANTYVEVADDNRLDMSESLTVTTWVHPLSYKSSLMSILSKDENYEFHLNNNGTVNWWWNNASGTTREFDSTSVVPLNTWTHVAIVYSQTEQVIYINGVASGSRNYTNELLRTNSDPLQIGDDQLFGGGSRRFDGYIDEVRVYDFPVRAQDIPLIMMETHPCPLSGQVAGFDITFGAGSASTCAPLPVTITAIDSSNNVLTSYAGNVQINTQTGHGDWAAGAPDTPVNPVLNGAADDGAATYQYDLADSGSIDLLLSNTHADVLTVSVSDAVAGVTSISAPITFRDNAFVVTPLTCTGVSCPATGSTEVVAGRDHVFSAALWRRDPSTGDCAIATAYDTGSNAAYGDLKAWITRDAVDPSGIAPDIAGNVLGNAAPAANNLDLSFTAGEAQFTLSTADVGKYSINLRDDTSGFAKDDRGTADTSDDLSITLDGSSATLTVRPFALGYTNINKDGTANPEGTAISGNGFVAAGDVFEATIGAYLWQGTDDPNNDGIVDTPDTSDVTNNGITPAYNFSTLLSVDTTGGYTPVAGIVGVLGGSLNPDAFSAGQQTVSDLTYSEVGSMRMLAAVTDYLGTSGVNIAGQTIVPVGRFYPHHFELSGANINPACVAGDFTYMDQPELEIDYTVQAHRLGSGITQNYFTTGYNVGTVSMVAEDSDDGNDLSFRLSNIGSATWVSGQYTVSTPSAQLDKDAAPDGPFDALQLGVQVTDADGAVLLNRDMDPDSAGACGAGCNSQSIGTTRVRYGRMEMVNAHGSELLPLNLPMLTSYYDGSNFIAHSDDSCTSMVVTNLDMSNDLEANQRDGNIQVGGGLVNASVVNSPSAAGRLDVGLSAPGAGNTGYIDVTADLSASGQDLPWLQFDWNGDGTDENPTGRATFGIFPGSPQQIYMQEVY
jgi:MSHA biogenesis protein MshQ